MTIKTKLHCDLVSQLKEGGQSLVMLALDLQRPGVQVAIKVVGKDGEQVVDREVRAMEHLGRNASSTHSLFIVNGLERVHDKGHHYLKMDFHPITLSHWMSLT